MKTEIYISTDIEADGPIPGEYSMLSFGSAAYLAPKTLYGTFSANLETLPGAKQDPDTMAWWKSKPEAWNACRTNIESPPVAMRRYYGWLDGLKDKGYQPVFVGQPATFDFMFVYWYLIKFVGASPFSFRAIDMKTFAMAILGLSFAECAKRNYPKDWFDKGFPHTHVALDDALEQGALFMNMLARANKDRETLRLFLYS